MPTLIDTPAPDRRGQAGGNSKYDWQSYIDTLVTARDDEGQTGWVQFSQGEDLSDADTDFTSKAGSFANALRGQVSDALGKQVSIRRLVDDEGEVREDVIHARLTDKPVRTRDTDEDGDE